jgi:hypothetical protein
MVVEEFRKPGAKPGRCGANCDVDEVELGNGEGTVSGALSVSLKKPPSMCGSSSSALMRDWRAAFSGLSEAWKLGVKMDAMLKEIVCGLSRKLPETYITTSKESRDVVHRSKCRILVEEAVEKHCEDHLGLHEDFVIVDPSEISTMLH